MKNNAINNRYEFVVLFDVENGNPNGDPDAGNMPRIDPETSLGIVTNVCIKRKIRNYVEAARQANLLKCEDGKEYNILIKADRSLNSKFTEAYVESGLEIGKGEKKKKSKNDEKIAQQYMCDNYYDVRTFGAVMSTGDDPCGIVRGPVQFSFARSIDPIFPMDLTITRQALTRDEDFLKQENTMGKKSIVPYALYRAEGYISAMLAQNVTGFSENDLEILWNAIINMFEHDRSAARGKMCVRKLIVFKHRLSMGNAPAHILTDKVQAKLKDGVVVPRSYSDYDIVPITDIPDGVELIEKL